MFDPIMVQRQLRQDGKVQVVQRDGGKAKMG